MIMRRQRAKRKGRCDYGENCDGKKEEYRQDIFFNPLNPNIKIQILICCPYTFSIEEVGRIC